MVENYNVIVVGGGHAGCEAAAAAANLGSKTLLITMDMTKMAQMSCNPAMGGIAKGQIVREIDALGGYSGIVSDYSAIQFRMLNLSKGPAMWSPRTQNDRTLFTVKWREMLESTPNLFFWQDSVTGILFENNKAAGVKTGLGLEIKSQAVIITSGTFLNGLIHIGEKQLGGGRMGEKAAHGITEQLVSLGFQSGRMKTGTPPRVDGRSLDYSVMAEQEGDAEPGMFSYLKQYPIKKQRSCHITYTNEDVHETLRSGFDRSPMFNGQIQSTGPRYCPSVEDKIHRFADKASHQIFVEPEGWNTHEVYVNGFSTSLPMDVQYKALRLVPGFENVKFIRPGYAIEYDYFPPTQLHYTLETKSIENLYFAGQINGTTGYEEAAAQGLMAGINAHQKTHGKTPFILSRKDAYIGVLIDDLITKGTEEPYRMFTSRSEFRILLRQDNADLRLTQKSFELGLASGERLRAVNLKQEETTKLLKTLRRESIAPEEANPALEAKNSAAITQKVKLDTILARPGISLEDLYAARRIAGLFSNVSRESIEQAEIHIKYDGYIQKEEELARKFEKLDTIKIPQGFDYHQYKSLSTEARLKLTASQPEHLGQASRISGINPSDIQVLLIHLSKGDVSRATRNEAPIPTSMPLKG